VIEALLIAVMVLLAAVGIVVLWLMLRPGALS
jgi:hypothetical protein